MRLRIATILAASLAVASAAVAQKPVSLGDAVTKTLSITAIDHDSRIVTLTDKDGTSTDIVCGPEVQRFDALKIGDKVTFRYYESLVSAITKPGAAAPAATSGVTRTPGTKPGGTIAQQLTATVVIQSIDPKTPSVTVKTDDGRTVSFAVGDKKYLQDFKAGDTVILTYTQALAISVEPAK